MLTADSQYLVVAYSDNWEYCENLMTRIMLDPPGVIEEEDGEADKSAPEAGEGDNEDEDGWCTSRCKILEFR
jgi:hypothetical protein